MDRVKAKRRRIERKYEKKIGQLIEEYKDKTMGELWSKFDELKLQMKHEFDKAGINLENN